MRLLIDLAEDGHATLLEVIETGMGYTSDHKPADKYLVQKVTRYARLRLLLEDLGLDTGMNLWLADQLTNLERETKRKVELYAEMRRKIIGLERTLETSQAANRRYGGEINQLRLELEVMDREFLNLKEELERANKKLAILDEIGMELEIEE